MTIPFLFLYKSIYLSYLQNRQYDSNRQIVIHKNVQKPSVKQLMIIPTATKKRANPHNLFMRVSPPFAFYMLLYAALIRLFPEISPEAEASSFHDKPDKFHRLHPKSGALFGYRSRFPVTR